MTQLLFHIGLAGAVTVIVWSVLYIVAVAYDIGRGDA